MKVELLTPDQCEMFMKTQPHIRLKFNNRGNNVGFQAFEAGRWTSNLRAHKTLDAAITAYQRTCVPDWQPPEPIRDAEWALKEIIDRDLALNVNLMELWQRGKTRKGVYLTEPATAQAIIEAVENWISKYATPEPSTLEVLEEVRDVLGDRLSVDNSTMTNLEAAIVREKIKVNKAIIYREKTTPPESTAVETLEKLRDMIDDSSQRKWQCGQIRTVLNQADIVIEREKAADLGHLQWAREAVERRKQRLEAEDGGE